MASPTMTVIFFVLAILVVGNVDSATPAAPSPVDCSSVILNLADCLSYVSAGSTVKKPEGTCCSGLKTILDTSPECLCEGLKSSSSFGITLDMNRAINLPKVCHLTASPPTCQLGPGTGGASPATPPTASTPNKTVSAPPPATGKVATPPTPAPKTSGTLAPASAPKTSGSARLAMSVGSLVVALVAASVSLS